MSDSERLERFFLGQKGKFPYCNARSGIVLASIAFHGLSTPLDYINIPLVYVTNPVTLCFLFFLIFFFFVLSHVTVTRQ